MTKQKFTHFFFLKKKEKNASIFFVSLFFPLFFFSLFLPIMNANNRINQILNHLKKTSPSLQDKVCIVTGAGSIHGIG
jgi:hypothetical protein